MFESQQYINWAKLFQVEIYLDLGNQKKAISILEDTIKAYVKNLDDNEQHPFLEHFYQVLCGVYRNNKMIA